jgi:cytochrome d ubiquinol oxidase subunit II
VTLADTVLGIMWIGMTAYVLFGGADFGGGFWDLLAGGAHRGAPQRGLIERVIGPVWEANHVWLIFVIVVMWTAFPAVFAAVFSTLYIPLAGAAVGIILRGAAFAFRKAVDELPLKRLFGATFAASSIITPFFLGTVAGGVASGRVPLGNAAGDIVSSWLNPTSLLGGVLAVLVCAYLAAVFLTADAAREGRRDLAEQFRVRGLTVAGAVGPVALGGIVVLRGDAPQLYAGLTGRAAPLVLLSAVAGIVAIMLLAARRYWPARFASSLAVVAVIWGWAVAQYPDLLVDQATVADAAAHPATLRAVLVSLIGGSILLVPSLLYLFVLFQRGTPDAVEPHDPTPQLPEMPHLDDG